MNDQVRTDQPEWEKAGFWRQLQSHYPFTIGGTLLIAVLVYLMGRGATDENGYALILSIAGFVFLIFLLADAYIQSYRMGHIQLIWDQGEWPVSRTDGYEQVLHLGEVTAHPFYRIHFVLRGDLIAGRNAKIRLTEEGSVSHGGEVRIPMRFPVCGSLHVKGSMYIRDVFGFVRVAAGKVERRTLTIRPPVIPEKPGLNYDSLLSLEVSRNKMPAEEEKYYMRQYQPGDRMKDINWKSSMRVFELITRISPLSPERSKIIHVEFRNVANLTQESAESVAHLNYLKSWMISFLHSVKKRYPDFRFRVISSSGSELLETHDEIHKYSAHIAPLMFVSPGSFPGEEEGQDSERFIFTTMFDPSISALAGSANPGVRFHVFRTNRSTEKDARRVRLFRDQAGYRTMPGFWIFRKEKVQAPAISPSGGGSLIEEHLQVRLF